jgi:modulator of FtsH protease HflK
VMRDRLYIDAMESVLSNSSKILVDVKGGSNLLYLPLDKLMQPPPSSAAATEDTARGASSTIVLDNERAATRRTSR